MFHLLKSSDNVVISTKSIKIKIISNSDSDDVIPPFSIDQPTILVRFFYKGWWRHWRLVDGQRVEISVNGQTRNSDHMSCLYVLSLHSYQEGPYEEMRSITFCASRTYIAIRNALQCYAERWETWSPVTSSQCYGFCVRTAFPSLRPWTPSTLFAFCTSQSGKRRGVTVCGSDLNRKGTDITWIKTVADVFFFLEL